MASIKSLFHFLVIVYLVALLSFLIVQHQSNPLNGKNEKKEQENGNLQTFSSFSQPNKHSQTSNTQFYSITKEQTVEKRVTFPQNDSISESQLDGGEPEDFRFETLKTLRESNPLYLLGAYPEIDQTYPMYVRRNESMYGFIKDDNYCTSVDLYNLFHPENMFQKIKFFTEFAIGCDHCVRDAVMRKMGQDMEPDVDFALQFIDEDYSKEIYPFNPEINMFHTVSDTFPLYFKIGHHFLCATQTYNHIPGNSALYYKDSFVDALADYGKKYQDRPQCFKKDTFYPMTYRLYDKEDCLAFFSNITSVEYQEKLKIDPVQFLIKVGHGSHRGQGVFLLNGTMTELLNKMYESGSRCGVEKQSFLAQSYIANPLLLNLNNKFDFRVYMLVASTNPLIVYYHDGFARASLSSYQKDSEDKSVHLTNTYLSKQVIQEASETNQTINGMSQEEVEKYMNWSFEDLLQYFLKSGKVTDPNWLDNYLRPTLKRAYIHLVRMTSKGFWNQSNVYEVYGLDFIFDDQMNLWFIEGNAKPELQGTVMIELKRQVFRDMLEIQFNYYRSRMKRLLSVVQRMQGEAIVSKTINYEKWKVEYQIAVKNRLEPEYQISQNNSFILIMDENLPKSKAYFGYIQEDCL